MTIYDCTYWEACKNEEIKILYTISAAYECAVIDFRSLLTSMVDSYNETIDGYQKTSQCRTFDKEWLSIETLKWVIGHLENLKTNYYKELDKLDN